MNTDSSPIAAIATAPGRGGVGIIRISGKNLEPFISEFFKAATTELPLKPRYAYFLPFLDENRRCSVHADRPGFCRIFPLGRYYQDGDFTYILQVHECPKPKTKIRVRKWVDISDADKNRVFINQWHDLQKEMQTEEGEFYGRKPADAPQAPRAV